EYTRRLTELGIPVMGHLALTPQFVHQMGGFKVQGKSEAQADRILADALALEEAGAFSIVLEGVPSALAGRDAFEHDAEGAGLLEREGVGQDAVGLGLALALDLETAHLVDELRREPEMAHHRDAELGQPARVLDHAAAALQLDSVHARLLDEAAGARDRLLGGL